MATATFTSGTSDGSAYWKGPLASYPSATESGVQSDEAYFYVGQFKSIDNYFVYQAGVSFNTSSLGAGATITGAALSLAGNWDSSNTDFDIEAFIYNWGSGISTSSMRTAAQLNALPRVAYLPTSSFTVNAQATFTDLGLAPYIDKTGTTYIWLCSSRWRSGTAPTGDEYVTPWSANTGTAAYRPTLTVTYTTSAIKSVAGLATAGIKSVAGVPTANAKSVAGLA